MESSHKGIGNAVDKLTKEEVEPINELSNTTKTRYIKKAKASSHGHHVQADYHVGRMNAGKKGSTKSYYRHMDKASKRMKGIDNAKASMEAVEPINELSKKTLQAYVRKTSRPSEMIPKHDKPYKRNAGRKKAMTKLNAMEAVELAPSRKATALALIAKGRQTKAPASMVKKK